MLYDLYVPISQIAVMYGVAWSLEKNAFCVICAILADPPYMVMPNY